MAVTGPGKYDHRVNWQLSSLDFTETGVVGYENGMIKVKN